MESNQETLEEKTNPASCPRDLESEVEDRLDPANNSTNHDLSDSIVIKHRRSSTTSRQSNRANGIQGRNSLGSYSSLSLGL